MSLSHLRHVRCCFASQTHGCRGLRKPLALHVLSHAPTSVGLPLADRLRRSAGHSQRSISGQQANSAAGFPVPEPALTDSATATSPALPAERRHAGSEFLAALQDLPWTRMAIWLTVVAAAYQLKDFFGIAMGTFITAFIGHGFVQSTQHAPLLKKLPQTVRRRAIVVLFFTVIVSVLLLFGVLLAPDIIREGSDFVSRLKKDSVWVVVLEKMRHGLGDGLMEQLERVLLVASGEDFAMQAANEAQLWTAQRTAALGSVLQNLLRGYTDTAISLTSNLITSTTRFAVQAGVSMVLSFMILWDLPTIRAGVGSLRTSRLANVYTEIAPSFAVFGTLFGKALQAQARIALVNTGLTALGMWGMRIPGIGLLSLFVFICSFIPIAGVFISTVPIAFVALTEYGFFQLALTVCMVTCIHFIEAYVLNPAIYSAHLKLHPLLVLSVLVIAEHSLGVWGLLLAVPLTVFLLDYCLRYPAMSMTAVAAAETETLTSIDRDYDPDSTFSSPAARKEIVKGSLGSKLGQLG